MDDRTRSLVAVAGTIGLFLCIQLGALALLDPYVAADAQPVEDPSNESNVAYFFGVILVATAGMLAAIKFGLERFIKGFVLLSCGWISWLVLDTLVTSMGTADVGSSTANTAVEALAILLPVAVGVGVVVALYAHPEWYVIDLAGILLGAGAAGLFGLAFTPELTIAFLVILAVYDAVSVYGTEHMLTLAEGVSDLNLPVMLVVPAAASFSLLDGDGPSTLESGDSTSEERGKEATGTEAERDGARDDEESGKEPEEDEDPVAARDAIFIGLGDAVMPTILVVSAAYFLRDSAPLFDVPIVAMNLPALTALIGTLIGLVALLGFVLKGRAHAGLPMLNGGAIGGYLVGALLSGIGLVEALGLPF